MCKRDLPITDYYLRRRRGKVEHRARCRSCENRIDYDRRAALKRGEAEPTIFFPVEPFRDWLALAVQRHGSRLRAATETGMSERRLRAILGGEQRRVTLDVVDRALANEGSTMLWELYPDE